VKRWGLENLNLILRLLTKIREERDVYFGDDYLLPPVIFKLKSER